MPYFAHPTAIIDEGAEIGEGTRIWHFAHIFPRVCIGRNCVFGQNTMVASGVKIGSNVKVQNNVAIYTGVEIEDDVFLGPSCVLTNVTNPRSQVPRQNIYERTLIRRGATVGANATIVCGVTLGRYAFVAAGAVVTKDIADYGCVTGVPARPAGWMSRHGHFLRFDDHGLARCPESDLRYEHHAGLVRCLDLDEDAALPAHLAAGGKCYDECKPGDQSSLIP